MTLPACILITGAAGNLGSKLRRHLQGRCNLRLLDRHTEGDPGILAADLTGPIDSFSSAFVGVDAVVHLAGNPMARADWPDLIGPNVDAVLNLFAAASRAGVRRVVFASSNHVMGGYRDLPEVRITADSIPKPGVQIAGTPGSSAAYAATKLFGERVGAHYAAHYAAHSAALGMEVVAVRIGWNWRGDNSPAGLPTDRDPWFRNMWLSDRDYLHLMECCLTAKLPAPFVVLNGMSANTGMPWDIDATRKTVGYAPQDDVYRGE